MPAGQSPGRSPLGPAGGGSSFWRSRGAWPPPLRDPIHAGPDVLVPCRRRGAPVDQGAMAWPTEKRIRSVSLFAACMSKRFKKQTNKGRLAAAWAWCYPLGHGTYLTGGH